MNKYKNSAMAIHPGEILKDELDAREWTQKEFARIIGRPEKTISAIIKGKKEITPDTAIEIAAALGTSPDVWNNMQAKYNLHVAIEKPKEQALIERRARLYSLVPVDELIARGLLTSTDQIDVLESKICEFLGLNSINDEFSLAASFRLADHRTIELPSVVAWLKIIEQKSFKIKASVFSVDSLKNAIPQIIALSKKPEDCTKVITILNRIGIKLVFESPFKGTHIDGAVIYIDNSPVIGMTLRIDRIDNFWFTLMHELGHIILRHKTSFVDVNVYDTNNSHLAPDERKANDWAANNLLPGDEYRKFVAKTKPYFSKNAISAFADRIGVHPGIIVGRLQKDGLLPWKNLRDLLEKVSPYITC